jgi:hypothetical protein
MARKDYTPERAIGMLREAAPRPTRGPLSESLTFLLDWKIGKVGNVGVLAG